MSKARRKLLGRRNKSRAGYGYGVLDKPMVRDHLFSQVFNFRDVGGLIGSNGRPVKWRTLFRSDSLHGLTELDRQAFSALGVRTVLDLRRPYEVERDGRVPDWDGLSWRHVHPDHREWTETPLREGQELGRYLADRYLDLAEEGVEGLTAAVSLIADQDSAPVVVHCLAGKDRTGVVCALTLSLLGVSDVDIATDYALSTKGLERWHAWLRTERPDEVKAIPPGYRSPAEAMLLFLQDLRGQYGSVSGYLTGAGGLDPARIEALRAHLLG
jgi:protein-tyrosine phosphatase